MFDCFTLVDPTDILTIGHAEIYSQGSVNCSASARRGAAGWAGRWGSGWTQTVCWAAATWSPRCGHLQLERGERRRDAQPLGRGPVARDEHKPQRREIQEMEAKREKVACVCRQFKFVPLL